MKSSKLISVKIISVIIVVMTFAFLMTSGLQGCKSNDVITEETSAETSSETSSASTQETLQQTDESTTGADIITDN
ncbi:MAG: hypothetical protein ACXWEW_09830, partial [Nitrososphaeraceae archaeon]